jgi:pimeloyl-ACP methyl ester carboxylesterase
VRGEALPLSVTTDGLDPGPGVEVFVLLHGYGASSFSWRRWVPHLTGRGHVLLVDLKGFGAAPRPDDGRYAPTDQAELVHRLLAQRGLTGVTLIGHSMGGGVALITALRLIDEGAGRLRRLVIVGGAAYRQRMPPFMLLARFRRQSMAALRVLGPRIVAGQVLRSIVYDAGSVTADQIEGYAVGLSGPEAHRVLIDTALQLLPDDLDAITARYREIDVPTLLMWGSHDRVVPRAVARRLARELPRARMRIVPRCGHLPAEEWPASTAAELLAFVDRTAPSLSAVPHPRHLEEQA